MATLLSGKIVADIKLNKLKNKIQEITSKTLCIAIIQVGNNKSSSMCIKMKQNKCKEIGIRSELFKLREEVVEGEVVGLINELNRREDITGIILQLPIPKHLNQIEIINSIRSDKDADGLTADNMGHLLLGIPKIIPATTCAILDMINHYEIDVSGKHVVILGRSNLVGKPTAIVLQALDATVMCVHTKTADIIKYIQQADIIIAACGSPSFVKKNMVKKGCVILDVGINVNSNKSATASGNIVGDVDFNDVIDIVGSISPVPGGIGPLTAVNMLCNTYYCFLLQCGEKILKL